MNFTYEGRKKLRLEGCDYSSVGYYFVTICTKGKIDYFGEIQDGEMVLNDYGDYEFAWQKSFHDVIIRNQDQLDKTREYIILNPSKWEEDSNNSINIQAGKK